MLKSYSVILKSKDQIKNLTIEYSELYSVDRAVKRMKEIFGSISEWTNLLNIIPKLIESNRVINKSIISSILLLLLNYQKMVLLKLNNKKLLEIFILGIKINGK